MDKQQLLRQLDKSWNALKASYAGLSDSQLMEPGVMGNWSVKEILAHVTTWEEEALKYLPVISRRKTATLFCQVRRIGAFNAQMTERSAASHWLKFCVNWMETHGRLVELRPSAPDEQFTGDSLQTSPQVRFVQPLPLHAKAIVQWREKSSE
jgi:hypothetical protein